MPKLIVLILISSLLIQATHAYAAPSSCDTLFYNYLTHSCEECPANSSPTPDPAFCNCSGQYYANPQVIGFKSVDPCLDSGVSISGSEILSVRDVDGAISPAASTCVNSYSSPDSSSCIPCGFNMQYNPTSKACECSNSNYVIIGQACIQKGSYTNPFTANTAEWYLFDKAQVGCIDAATPDPESCQILLNQCAKGNYNNNFCNILGSLQLTENLEALNVSLGIFASSITGTNSKSVKNRFVFRLFKYDVYGRLVDIKPLDEDLIPCLATSEDIIKFQSFGLNLLKICTSGDLSIDANYFYDVFVEDVNGSYVQVFAVNGQEDVFRRRIVPGGFSSSIQMAFTSIPPVITPYLNMTAQKKPTILTSSKQETVNLTLVAPFIVFNIGLLLVFVLNFYRYIKYNPDETNDPLFFFQALLIFFLMAMKHWGVGMWIFLFGTSAYCFCFYKFQQTVYLLLPDQGLDWQPYYHSFMALFYVQYAFVFFSVCYLIFDMSKTTDYFLIDWEKEKNASKFDINMGGNKRPISVWRKVLLVNELYELSINRLINTEFVTLFALLFLDGLDWINLQYQIPNTENLKNDSSSTRNLVLSYFIITFVFFIIAAVQLIIRHLARIWMPLPHEDFIDLCSIANISIVIFDESLHGYYIHGMNPVGQAEGSLNFIESVFEKESRSFGKSRAFRNDDPDQVQTFEVVFPFEIRQAFQMKYKNMYLQKLLGKAYDTSMFSRPIPEMLDENDYKEIEHLQNQMLDSFKYYLEGVKTSQFNVKERTFLQKFISCPLDMDIIGKLPIFFKDYWSEFTNVLMSGHEFLFLLNTINFVNIFYVATKNIFMAIFITMVITRILIKNIADGAVKRNISKNTLIDDKFFN